MKFTKPFLLSFILLIALSCNKDDSPNSPQNQEPDPTAFAQNFGSEISRTFLGTVLDINDNPIENAQISIGSSTAMTDANGIFIINNATVNERFGYVKAEKAGFIRASRAVVPSEGTNKIRITMLAETIVGTTSSGTQETISLQDGASVALEGDYIKADGSSYSGNVNVIMHHLDPADGNMPDQMPGMLYAANSQNEARMLETFGMLAVELRGENGEDLNLAEGSTAEITVPLDPSLMVNAPSSIPLWYFDEINGYWIEDGEATLVGNTYVGTVSHFSFWNCDIPIEAVNLCVTAVNSDNNSLANLIIGITSNTYGTRNGYTNENGQVCGLVPSNESLEVNVSVLGVGNCISDIIYSTTIGPFSTDSSIVIEITDFGDLDIETVLGSFETCSGNPVDDGYVFLNNAGFESYEYVDDGDFEINFLRCDDNDTFYLKGYDFVNLQETDSIAYTYTSPITNIGTLTACNTIDEFIQYQIDQENEVTIATNLYIGLYFSPSSPTIPRLSVQGFTSNDDNQDYFFFQFRLNDNPPYTGAYNHTGFGDDIGFGTEGPVLLNNESIVISYITNFGEVNEFVDINFDGTYEDPDGTMHTFNGIIHARRDQ
ncbi:carboxypeptidase-like regulatory domain-containing protein [Psychroserpens sp. Hel_I_66]|uniref:carboxypeptidase-like regulatory domain-containing protein n=1 Tax=Psychroserpens sp. Hel_I_66 TaxID=1250004 RepID=UPI000AD64180|nr:carboxypeptidase-like regulatory domain-containing protein [Psychroserpens sp. Hel_I_66]